MQTRRDFVAAAAALAVFILLPAAPARADRWKPHIDKEYGVTLLAPGGVKFQKEEWAQGWKGVRASGADVDLVIAALPGKKIPALMMREKAEELSGLARDHWTVIRTYKAKRGWIWYCTARAAQGDRVALAVYGIGPRSTTYLALITTSKKGEKKLRKQLKKWSRTITVR